MFCLPPHTTHRTQPLDKGVFGPLKMAWRNTCKEYMTHNPGKVVRRHAFSRLFCHAWERSMTMSYVITGFRVTGIYPFNRNALNPSLVNELPPKSNLKYIPLLTPSRITKNQAFTAEETQIFQSRYVEWLKQHHPESVNLNISSAETQDCQMLQTDDTSTSSDVQRELSFADEEDLLSYHHHHQSVLSRHSQTSIKVSSS